MGEGREAESAVFGGDNHPEKALSFEKLPDLRRQILVVFDNLPVIKHGAELFDRAVEKGLFRRRQGRGREGQELLPIRMAAEEFTVPADTARLQGLALGGGEGRQHPLEKGKEGGSQDRAAQRDNDEQDDEKSRHRGKDKDWGHGCLLFIS